MNKKLKIACYAVVCEEAGSVASANFLILRELLLIGHQIDLIEIKDYTQPGKLVNFPNLKRLEIYIPWIEKIRQLCPALLRKIGADIILGRLGNLLYHRIMIAKINEKPYDLVLFLGTPSFFDFDVKTISWLQGVPHTEWKSIRKGYWKLPFTHYFNYFLINVYYYFHCLSFKKKLLKSDILIVGSKNTADWLDKIYKNKMPKKVFVLPYPIDLELFRPAKKATKNKTILWLGRIVPRKRIDLLLKAFELFRKSNPDYSLKVIGDLRYASRYQDLMNKHMVNHIEYVKRTTAVKEIQKSSLVIQTSEDENFGSAIAEALACGKPALIGSSNGTGDHIGGLNLFFDAYDPTNIARNLDRVIKTQYPENKLRKIAEMNFDPCCTARQLENIFHESICRDSANQ